MPSESDLSNRYVWCILDGFLNYLLSATCSVPIFPYRIRLEDSFGQNIINFHKIWAEYGAVKGFCSCTFFLWIHTWWTIMIFINLKNSLDTSEPLENIHLDLWKTPVLRERSFHVTRRAVVSRVIRVQRRYAVRIRPIQSVVLVYFR